MRLIIPYNLTYMGTISTTDFKFPGQTGLYHGKVRDVYTIKHNTLVSVASDRISAFDVILPVAIPFKGQVLNQLAAYFLEQTEQIAPNWLRAVPDPNVSVGIYAEPYKVEMVIRGALVGHAWREYRDGQRQICGQSLADGLKEYDKLASPIITPTTKATAGHDEDITPEQVVSSGLVTQQEWHEMASLTKQLFEYGQAIAAQRNLFLADTKYEFGKLNGRIILIDEVHTPDSSRYFYKNSYDAYLDNKTSQTPKHLSKEFVRSWLIDHDFSGLAGQTIPDIDADFVNQISERYIELYETMTAQSFVKPEEADSLKRIADNLTNYLTQGDTQ
jgi:phosphoribosylaminoimidazole-succinocarboxamide synthase